MASRPQRRRATTRRATTRRVETRGRAKSRGRARRRSGPFFLAPLLALGLAVPVLALDLDGGLLALVELRAQVGQAREMTQRLERERLELRERVRGLRVDPFHVEAAARSALGMVRPGEVVVRLGRPED